MTHIIFKIAFISFLILAFQNTSYAQTEQIPINLVVEAYMPSSPSEDEETLYEQNLEGLYQEIRSNGLTGTFFATQDFIDTHARLPLTRVGLANFELAMSGNHSGEKISAYPLEEQKAILKKSKDWVEACRICGKNEIIVRGFMPQSFDQNKDTYEALDDLGIEYNTGFQAGIIYEPGHEKDIWPYKVANYGFYAIPISTYELSGEKMPLIDSYAKENGLSSTQWYDMLVDKYEEAKGNEEPLVIGLNTSISGTGDYLEALKKFMGFAKSEKALFVTTIDLVNMSRKEGYVPPARTTEECTTCGQKSNETENTNISIKQE